jgi:acetoin utilization protein AcuC
MEGPGIFVETASPARREDLLRFHTEAYLTVLKAANAGNLSPGLELYGIGPGDNPVFPGMYDWSCIVVGASLKAGRKVARGEVKTAFNIAGGLHHAHRARASGFCYINDPVILIKELIALGKKVLYIDIDVHHGDGVQWAFYEMDQVMTISFHQDGRTLFPGTGFTEEIGRGDGEGFSVNVPLLPGTDDELYVRAFDEIVPSLVHTYDPDILVSQLGVDTFRTDPLANLELTTNGLCQVVKAIKGFSLPWVALGGGGYDILNVARAWTLAWAIMNEKDPPDTLPEAFLKDTPFSGSKGNRLRDNPYRSIDRKDYLEEALLKTIAQIKERIFPKVGV